MSSISKLTPLTPIEKNVNKKQQKMSQTDERLLKTASLMKILNSPLALQRYSDRIQDKDSCQFQKRGF